MMGAVNWCRMPLSPLPEGGRESALAEPFSRKGSLFNQTVDVVFYALGAFKAKAFWVSLMEGG